MPENRDIYLNELLPSRVYYADRNPTNASVVNLTALRTALEDQTLPAILCSEVAVGVFGGVARGDAKPSSDTDIFVFYDSQSREKTPRLARLKKEVFVEALLWNRMQRIHAFPVDIPTLLSRLDGQPENFIGHEAFSVYGHVVGLFGPNFIVDEKSQSALTRWREQVMEKIRNRSQGEAFLGHIIDAYIAKFGHAVSMRNQMSTR